MAAAADFRVPHELKVDYRETNDTLEDVPKPTGKLNPWFEQLATNLSLPLDQKRIDAIHYWQSSPREFRNAEDRYLAGDKTLDNDAARAYKHLRTTTSLVSKKMGTPVIRLYAAKNTKSRETQGMYGPSKIIQASQTLEAALLTVSDREDCNVFVFDLPAREAGHGYRLVPIHLLSPNLKHKHELEILIFPVDQKVAFNLIEPCSHPFGERGAFVKNTIYMSVLD